jgi:hypothetical protein
LARTAVPSGPLPPKAYVLVGLEIYADGTANNVKAWIVYVCRSSGAKSRGVSAGEVSISEASCTEYIDLACRRYVELCPGDAAKVADVTRTFLWGEAHCNATCKLSGLLTVI